jgi:hypothetical protein
MRIAEYIQNKTLQIRRRFHKYPRLIKWIGYACVVIGILAFFTPFTPGSWLALVGIEILGIRVIITKKLKPFFITSRHLPKE